MCHRVSTTSGLWTRLDFGLTPLLNYLGSNQCLSALVFSCAGCIHLHHKIINTSTVEAPFWKWFYQLGTGGHTERIHGQSSI